MKSFTLKKLTQAAVIAALYTALTFISPFSFTAAMIPITLPGMDPFIASLQFRVSEILCIMPIFTPTAIPGLFVGCLLSNIIGGLGILDIIFGSLATLLAAYFTYVLRKQKFLATLPPSVFNGIIIGYLLYILGYSERLSLPLTMLSIAISEFIMVSIFGMFFIYAIIKTSADKYI